MKSPNTIERKWISPIRANLLSDHNIDYDHHLGQDLMDVFHMISQEKLINSTDYNSTSRYSDREPPQNKNKF